MRAAMRLAPTLAALAAGALLAGCGGSSHPKTTSTSGAGPVTKGQALALAQAINLKPADVAGFKAIPSSGHETPQEKALTRELETCAGGAGEAHKLAEAKSDEFKREAKGLPQEVSSSVSIEQTPAYAEQDLKAIRSRRGQACIVKLVNEVLKARNLAGAKVGAVSIREGTPPAPGTNGAFALRVTLPISVQGVTVQTYFDFLGFVTGSAEVTLQSVGVTEPFPAATQEHLFRVLVQRARTHPA
jgi:hypothetical protein